MHKKAVLKSVLAAVLIVTLLLSVVVNSILGKYVGTFSGQASLSRLFGNVFNNTMIKLDVVLSKSVSEGQTPIYARGEAVTFSSVTVHYQNNPSQTLNSTQYTVTGADTSTTGYKTITVSYTEAGNGTISTNLLIKVVDVASIMVTPLQNTYNVGDTINISDFQIKAITNEGTVTEIKDSSFLILSNVDTATKGTKNVTVTYNDGKVVLTATCAIEVMNLTLLTGNKEHAMRWFFDGNFCVSGWAHLRDEYLYLGYANFVGQTYPAPNGETVTGFNTDWKTLDNGSVIESNNGATLIGLSAYIGENRYDLTIDNALPYTTVGINCVAGYDTPFLGFGYYIDYDTTTLQYSPIAKVYTTDDPGYVDLNYDLKNSYYGYCGQYNGHALTQFTCYDFEPGKQYQVNWVVVFEDGIQPLSTWTVNMKEADENDAAFIDTDKPNVNVILMAGQSNMFGASPLTQSILDTYQDVTFDNVFINYRNINFNLDMTMSTFYGGNGFNTYNLKIGGADGIHFGPELPLAVALATNATFKDEQWYIIKYAPAGTGLAAQWNTPCVLDGQNVSSLTDDMINFIQGAIDTLSVSYDVKIRSFMWMQGEGDTGDLTTANAYAGNERHLVTRVRTAFAAYATRHKDAATVPGSGIAFIDAGIAYYKNGINGWTYAEAVNNGKISNAYWWCSPVAVDENTIPVSGPFKYKGYPFLTDLWDEMQGTYVQTYTPTIKNQESNNMIANSIYIDTHHLLSKLEASDEEKAQYIYDTDKTDGAHYATSSMLALGELYFSCLHYLITQE